MRLKKRLNILVTAGPTREPIDPVRFVSNYSTGLFGYEIAKEAEKRGHRVILISGPTTLAKPKSVRSIDVCTACQMREKLASKFSWCDCLIMTAAVCDFRAKTVAKKKIKRGKRKRIILELKQKPDILGSLGLKKGKMLRRICFDCAQDKLRRKKILVGFALETEDLKKNAQDKLRQKNLDFIVATQIKANSYPFGQVRLDALIGERKDHIQQVRKATKARLSRLLLEKIENLSDERSEFA